MPPTWKTILLLTISNVFMTFAWYGHLKICARSRFSSPSPRAGASRFSNTSSRCRQIASARPRFRSRSSKILQEVITLSVFVPFALFYMQQPFKLDFVWAGLCLLGALYFIFRN